MAETSSSRDSEPAETRGSWVKWTRHLARKSRVSSNENGPQKIDKIRRPRTQQERTGRRRTASRDRSYRDPRCAHVPPSLPTSTNAPVPSVARRSTLRSPVFSNLPGESRQRHVLRDLPGSTTVHRTHGRSGTVGAIARVVIPHRPRTSLQTRVIRFASPSLTSAASLLSQDKQRQT